MTENTQDAASVAASAEKLKETALGLLPGFRNELDLNSDSKCFPDDNSLLRFLYWKPNIHRAKERYHKLRDYHRNNPWAFGKVNDDPVLKRVLESEVIVAPDGMLDKMGRAVVVGRLRNNDMSDGRTAKDVARMAVYTIDRLLERPEAQTKGVVVMHDLKGLSRSNVDPGIPKLIFEALLGHFPLRIQGIYLLDAPFFFKLLFNVIGIMMPTKLKQRTHFVSSIDEIPIEKSELLVEHGGNRVHDQKAWVELQTKREQDGSMISVIDAVATSKN
jgi:hypothetical protein